MSKSNQEVAREIAKRYTREGTGYADRLYQLAYAIEQALNAERERCAKIAEAAENKWLTDARNVARADDLVGGLAQSTYTMYAEIAGGIAKTIRGKD